MPLSVHDEFRKPPMRSRSTKSSASGLAYSSTRLSINEIGVDRLLATGLIDVSERPARSPALSFSGGWCSRGG